MDWDKLLYSENEQPLDSFVTGISNMAIFRTVGFIGDSLSSGEFESRDSEGKAGFHDYYEYSWGQYIARKNGLKAYNFSKGGMTAHEYVTSFADKNRFWSPEYACGAYVIALGVNDANKFEAGDIGDENDEGKKTFAHYYLTIIKRLKAIQPRAKFFLVTIPDHSFEKEGKNETAATYRKLLKKICETYENCYLVDLYTYAPKYDKKFQEKFFLYGHMNASGYILTANMIDSYIDYIIRHNPDDFRRVAFIGTELS